MNTVKMPDNITDEQVSAIDTERALLAPERVRQVVEYIRHHFDQKTRRAKHYDLKGRPIHGFNSLFATASIEAARSYYTEFAAQQQELPEAQRLKVGIIFSYSANEDEPDGLLSEEGFDTDALDGDSRSFLEAAITDYNAMFGTSYDTSAKKFENYYKDLSARLKKREIDLVIVVNMFLTGFDATTLNTLWVDKNLRSHGLLQAFSRTNRILNSVKTYGNIICFRDLDEATNDAIALFGNKDAQGIVLLKPYADYYEEYAAKIAELVAVHPLGTPIVGEAAQKNFISLFGAILRLRNILLSFDEFATQQILSERNLQDYMSIYLNFYQDFRSTDDAEKESIIDDIVFEIELVKQVEINVDYVLMLVKKHRDEHGDGDDKEVRAAIGRAVDSSPSLRNKKDLIEAFVDSLSVSSDVDEAWGKFVAAKRTEELATIIEEETLDADAAQVFIDTAFRDGSLQAAGTAITRILPPVSRFASGGGHGAKKAIVVERLTAFFDRFFGLG